MNLEEIINELERLYKNKERLELKQEKLSARCARAWSKTRTRKKINVDFGEESDRLLQQLSQNRAEIDKLLRWQNEILDRQEMNLTPDGSDDKMLVRAFSQEGRKRTSKRKTQTKITSEFQEYEEYSSTKLTPFRPKMKFKYEILTFGTWRIAPQVVARELKRRKVKVVLDIRGNPNAGREKQFFKKAFTKTLKQSNIRYEYHGLQFTQERFEENEVDLPEILGLVSPHGGVVAILGHMHEPWKCHRLHFCHPLYLAGATVEHLLWASSFKAETQPHLQVFQKSKEKERYWNLAEEEIKSKKAKMNWKAELATIEWEDYEPEMLEDGNNYRIKIPFDTEILWFPNFLSKGKADKAIRDIQSNIRFHFPILKFNHSTGIQVDVKNRRGVARISDDYNTRVQGYRKDQAEMESYAFQDWSLFLKDRVEESTGYPYNAIGMNYYGDGTVAISPHADTAIGLGQNPVIASLSVGSTRMFVLKSKRKLPNRARLTKLYFPLHHGSLLVMGKNCQKYWLHQINADESIKLPRWNMTFRMFADKTLLKDREEVELDSIKETTI